MLLSYLIRTLVILFCFRVYFDIYYLYRSFFTVIKNKQFPKPIKNTYKMFDSKKKLFMFYKSNIDIFYVLYIYTYFSISKLFLKPSFTLKTNYLIKVISYNQFWKYNWMLNRMNQFSEPTTSIKLFRNSNSIL